MSKTDVELSKFIKSEALKIGFHACGISRADSVDKDHSDWFDNWLNAGYHGSMEYLTKNREKRYNPTLLFENCKSVISVALNYFPDKKIDKEELHMAYFAYSIDYHTVVKELLYSLLDKIRLRLESEGKKINGRAFCDSAPLTERFWAWKSGLGWIGKNHCFIIPNAGSYFFLGELLVDIELATDSPINMGCDGCNACLKACPTKALSMNYNNQKYHNFDSSLCLSYLTIEHKEHLTRDQGVSLQNCFFGCDICQEVCPHNKKAKPTTIKKLLPNRNLLYLKNEDWETLSEEHFNKLFYNSTVKRVGFKKLSDNIAQARYFTDKE